MNRIIYFLVLTIFIISCDIIEPPYTIQNNSDTNGIQIQQKVFVEYFTGHKCINCPTESKRIRDLQVVYGVQLIYMSVHAGWFASPDASGSYTTDYRTTVGDELDNYFDVTAISTPNALINRTKFEENIVLTPTTWSSAISNIINNAPKVKILLNASYTSSSISVDVKIIPLVQLNGPHNLTVFLVEDSLQSYQKNNNPDIGPTPDILDYYHRYVLRNSMNSTWGEQVFSSTAELSDTFNLNLNSSYPAAEWNINRMYAICIIYNSDSEEILQVEKVKI